MLPDCALPSEELPCWLALGVPVPDAMVPEGWRKGLLGASTDPPDLWVANGQWIHALYGPQAAVWTLALTHPLPFRVIREAWDAPPCPDPDAAVADGVWRRDPRRLLAAGIRALFFAWPLALWPAFDWEDLAVQARQPPSAWRWAPASDWAQFRTLGAWAAAVAARDGVPEPEARRRLAHAWLAVFADPAVFTCLARPPLWDPFEAALAARDRFR